LVEQSFQSNFVPQGRQYILFEAIGRLERPGRVRAARKVLNLKL